MARRGTMGRRDSGNRDEGRGHGRDRDRDRDRGESSSRGRGRGRDRDDDSGSRRGGSGFKYNKRDSESAKSRAEGDSDRINIVKEGVNRYTPKGGPNIIRILPPTWEGAKHFGFDIYCHYSVGPENASFLSLHKMKDEDDPIWEEYSKAEADGDEDYASELRPKHRVGYWLIDRDDERKGPQLWLSPYASIDRELSKQMIDSRTGEVLLIDHPEDGYDVEFDKSGEKARTKYEGVRIARSSSDLGRDATDWLDYVTDSPIPDCLIYSTYDEIANVFHARGGARSGGGSRGDSDRGDSRDRGDRDRGGRDDPEPTEREIRRMSFEDLDDLIMEKRLDIDGQEFNDEEGLADAVITELGLGERQDQPERGRGRDSKEDDDRYDRMERGRGGRGRR